MLGPPVVDPSVPGHELLQQALDIDAQWRAGGIQHFAFLPAERPPDLRKLETIDADDGIVDVYDVGTPVLRTIVKYTARRPGPCGAPVPGVALCLFSGPVGGGSPDAPSVAYARVQLSGGPKAGDPVTTRAAAFWGKTELVPLREAPWFADLVQEALVAAGRA
ncbi:hypothetical protein [Paractinoplanes durhamensis]|uniref:Uncharacterized protein n=1 Tax=Paractinoplanes durhamensis TaxID=113563 RepID=A0ABQ3YY06_9ACTN|nr:hypothetical protein Adu01nite_38130 [Actinoplanes durhamensis]